MPGGPETGETGALGLFELSGPFSLPQNATSHVRSKAKRADQDTVRQLASKEI
jgi:hypothetical protein